MQPTSASVPFLQTWLPGLHVFRTYDKNNLSSDVIAGISVAAVAIPIGIAYAGLAGAPPVVGIYSCLAPPIMYALFGSSRQLIVNPDAAACTIVAATTAPLAAGDVLRYADLSILLTLFTGLICIVAGIARLGFIANFLSRPILIGYLNGIAVSIIVGQLGKLMGVQVPSAGVFRTTWNLFKQASQLHAATLVLGLTILVGLLLIKRFAPRIPGPVIAAVAAIAVVYLFGLNNAGVQVIGTIPAGLPRPHLPGVAFADLGPVTLGAATIMLVSFCSMMTTARGFATKNGYQIDANRDLIALGACDLSSGLSGGFVVSGADSRTAVADSAGGKTQLTGVVAAIAIAIVLVLFTAPLGYLPSTALAAILISSSISLFDLKSLRRYYHLSKPEFRHAMVAMLGVMSVGVLAGVIVAIGLALLRLIMLASKPHDAVLGIVPGKSGFINMAEHADAQHVPGVLIYRFDSGMVFFNADYFANRVRQVVRDAQHRPTSFILNAESMPILDTTGADILASVHAELEKQGMTLSIARSKGWFRETLEKSGLVDRIGRDRMFSTLEEAIEAHAHKIDKQFDVESADLRS
jgi:high affinity sulfate transporter 1